MKNIAIIPARSGSKGLKDKNIRPLLSKPLIAYTIEAALESRLFDTVMVSTDSEAYVEIAKKHGAEAPFLRSTKNSSDTATSWDTVEEVLTNYNGMGRTFDTFCLLQPTSPLRSVRDLVQAYKIFSDKNAVAVVSVCELEHPLSWCGTLDEKQSLDGFIDCKAASSRQKSETHYRINGAIYVLNISEFRKDRFFYRKGAYAYVMPKERSIDIDTEFDFQYAEFLLENFFRFK